MVAALLAVVAYLSREVAFVLNAAFSLRGLTSGALLGGLLWAVFSRRGGARPVVIAMLTSLTVMTAIQVLPKLSWTAALWKETIGPEIFWPWYTLIGAVVTLATAWVVRRVSGPGQATDQAWRREETGSPYRSEASALSGRVVAHSHDALYPRSRIVPGCRADLEEQGGSRC